MYTCSGPDLQIDRLGKAFCGKISYTERYSIETGHIVQFHITMLGFYRCLIRDSLKLEQSNELFNISRIVTSTFIADDQPI